MPYTQTHTHDFDLPESRVSPQPPVLAPGVQSYILPTFPSPDKSAGADPNPTNAIRRSGTDAGEHPDLAAGHKSRHTLGLK